MPKKEPVKKTAAKSSKKEVEEKIADKTIPEEESKVEEKVEKKKLKKGFISGTGRRKTATARVFLWQTKGDFIVNDMPINKYFPSEVEQTKWAKPFHTVGVAHPEAKFSFSIKVSGSGKSSQLDAIAHGIARALATLSEENQKALRKAGLLTRDSRMVERKKYYLHKARKRPQYSKR